MVNTPGTNHAIGLAKRYPKLGVGLHFNLTEGKAMSGISSITNLRGKVSREITFEFKLILNGY